MAGKDVNIVRLDSAVEPPPPAAVPDRVVPVRVHTIDHFRLFLPPLFDQADDTLFSMSGHATLHGEQSLLFDGMRALRMQKASICEKFIIGLARWFEPGSHLSESQDDSASHLSRVRADRLSLVGEEDLEEQLAIAGLLERVLQGETGKQLLSLNKRLASLYDLIDLPAQCTPVGPVAAGRVFLSAIEALELPLKVRLVVLKIFEQTYLKDAENFYRRSNNELRDSGVCPNLEKEARQNRAQAAREANGCHEHHPEEALSASSPMASEPATVANEQTQASADRSVDVSVMGHQELMGLLSSIQANQPEIEPGMVIAGPSLRETMDIALAGTQGTKALDKQDNELIDMVSMLFEFILDDHELSDAIKALIGRMQVPVLKLAILDRSFLSKRSHPARQLLNGLASAGVQVRRQGEAQNKRLCRKVEKIVVTILQEFSSDIALFDRALKSFESFLEKEKERVGRFEERAKVAEEARNRSEQARLEVQETIDLQIKGRMVPDSIDPLLHEAWGSYLFILYLKQGRDGAPWKRAVNVVDHIVSSVQSCDSQEEMNRRRTLFPKLYETLELSLSSISYDPCLVEMHLKNLKNIHNKQSQEDADEMPGAGQTMTVMEELDKLAEQSEVKESVLVHDLTNDLNDAAVESERELKKVKPFKTDFNQKLQEWDGHMPASGESIFDCDHVEEGEEECIVMESEAGEDFDELEFEESSLNSKDIDFSGLRVGTDVVFGGNDNHVTCRLAEITAGEHYIFENANGLRVADKTRKELTRDLLNGSISLPLPPKKEEQVFDRAIQSVIGNFRLFGDRK